MLLGNDGLQGDGSIAVSPTAVVEHDMNLLHWAEFGTDFGILRGARSMPCG
jgi:hypothetical protein